MSSRGQSTLSGETADGWTLLTHPRITLEKLAHPFADPAHDYLNPLRYIASNTLTSVALALILAVGLAQAWLLWRYNTCVMLARTIGYFLFAIGLATRYRLHEQPRNHGIYVAQYLFVVLSPYAFIAAEYVLLGRLAHWLRTSEHLLVTPERITRGFVLSDLSTFLVQLCDPLNCASVVQAGADLFAFALQALPAYLTLHALLLRLPAAHYAELARPPSPYPWLRQLRTASVAPRGLMQAATGLATLVLVDPALVEHPTDVRFQDALYVPPSTRTLVFLGEFAASGALVMSDAAALHVWTLHLLLAAQLYDMLPSSLTLLRRRLGDVGRFVLGRLPDRRLLEPQGEEGMRATIKECFVSGKVEFTGEGFMDADWRVLPRVN